MDEMSRIRAVKDRIFGSIDDLSTIEIHDLADMLCSENYAISNDDIKLLFRCIIDGWKGE